MKQNLKQSDKNNVQNAKIFRQTFKYICNFLENFTTLTKGIASSAQYWDIMENFSTYREAVRKFVLIQGGCDCENVCK